MSDLSGVGFQVVLKNILLPMTDGVIDRPDKLSPIVAKYITNRKPL